MKKELAIKQIFNDFITKTILTDNEKDILIRYIKNDSIIKISNDTSQSPSSVSRVIAMLKEEAQSPEEVEMIRQTAQRIAQM